MASVGGVPVEGGGERGQERVADLGGAEGARVLERPGGHSGDEGPVERARGLVRERVGGAGEHGPAPRQGLDPDRQRQGPSRGRGRVVGGRPGGRERGLVGGNDRKGPRGRPGRGHTGADAGGEGRGGAREGEGGGAGEGDGRARRRRRLPPDDGAGRAACLSKDIARVPLRARRRAQHVAPLRLRVRAQGLGQGAEVGRGFGRERDEEVAARREELEERARVDSAAKVWFDFRFFFDEDFEGRLRQL